jgi:hypothetical protein
VQGHEADDQNGKLLADSDASRVRSSIRTYPTMPLTERTTIIAFKAGRAFRREGTNIVEPSADKGAIVIERGEDDLLHFMWKNRVTEETEEVFTSCITPNSILADHILGSHFVPD